MTSFLATFLCLISLAAAAAQTRVSHLVANEGGTHHKLDNPISVQYLKSNLSKHSPRLLLTPAIEKKLLQKLKSDPLVQNYYRYLQKEASLILERPLLKRELEGLNVSIISLDPPPLEIDKSIDNLKRLEIRIPAWILRDVPAILKVRLSEK